ncbi:septin Spn1 [Schizosaccharomyces cryophilus OY26]|uniref:Septin Spn1 n=1 Tax=Schizosaccharomyces cryophilus (strain OY26 / ATCC MYA-4695 / CBS 11777 / NBRC 106824 / NRRL Y48691) TaxID=653667 RepID=S9X5W3_SCHCR|nr:septin Spn1 [Schizosaccharomyces cryophilus OY26]EPY52477.1 septin Spn1 [Schizosaccharomyces cryophilus OY26]
MATTILPEFVQETVQEDISHHSFTSNSEAESYAAADSRIRNDADVEPSQGISIIQRKLNGYVGFSTLPNQWHRRCVLQGFFFNLMVLGESGSGKSTLVNTLLNKDVHPLGPQPLSNEQGLLPESTVEISNNTVHIIENGINLEMTVIDTPGFGDFIDNTNCWEPIVNDIENRYNEYLDFEKRLPKSAIKDPRIHACIFFIQPTGHAMSVMELQVLLALHEKVNIIPVIAKADTLTDEEINLSKEIVLRDIQQHNIRIFVPPTYPMDDPESVAENADIMSRIPFAIIASNSFVVNSDGRRVRARKYPWGIVEIDNEEHSDFPKLREMLIRTHLEELKDRTNDLYEDYRTERLIKSGISQDHSVFREINPAAKLEEERALHEEKLMKMEAEMKVIFSQKVKEKEDRLNQSEKELRVRHRDMKTALEKQKVDLVDRKNRLTQSKSSEHEKSKRKFFK